ncbi:hypothetical protein [Bdellovibrio sp. HCB337]|uniref:hypothetical protein n=1 Tax=Bdellovibrio sp. HCB337 TaxID=3394358 RepID=UPI0039A46632
MKKTNLVLAFSLAGFLVVGCGLKVINPNDKNPNEGTLALQTGEGGIKITGTYSCKLQSMGNRFWGMGNTEEDARKEVMAKCQSHTVLSFCDVSKATCMKN